MYHVLIQDNNTQQWNPEGRVQVQATIGLITEQDLQGNQSEEGLLFQYALLYDK